MSVRTAAGNYDRLVEHQLLPRGDLMSGPVLFCYDGSEDSGAAMRAAGELIVHPVPIVVLTVWQTAAALLAQAGGFAVGFGDEQQFDADEAKSARQVAEQAAALGRERGYEATPRVEQAREGVARTIIDVAGELDARLIVCGRRGRGPIASTVLGSVSHAVLARSGRAVLIVPKPHRE
jgi:nucleotide-binding universal stress UspA family protein